MSSRRAAAVAAVVGAALLAGCTAADSPDDLDVARYERVGEGGDGALLEGVAAELDGCLVIERGEDRGPVIPILPYGEAAPSAGEQVSYGGGGSGEAYGDVPASCAATGLDYFLVHFP